MKRARETGTQMEGEGGMEGKRRGGVQRSRGSPATPTDDDDDLPSGRSAECRSLVHPGAESPTTWRRCPGEAGRDAPAAVVVGPQT